MGEDKRREESAAQKEKALVLQGDSEMSGRLYDRLEKIALNLERSQMAEYVDLLNRPFSLIWRNIVAGISRGVGYAIGLTVFAATILYILQALGQLNLPIIGDYIADIVRIVQIQLEGKSSGY